MMSNGVEDGVFVLMAASLAEMQWGEDCIWKHKMRIHGLSHSLHYGYQDFGGGFKCSQGRWAGDRQAGTAVI